MMQVLWLDPTDIEDVWAVNSKGKAVVTERKAKPEPSPEDKRQ